MPLPQMPIGFVHPIVYKTLVRVRSGISESPYPSNIQRVREGFNIRASHAHLVVILYQNVS